MKPVFFISDLHLDESRPAMTDLFIKFLENEAIHCQQLYILGDLVEAWLGDDAIMDEQLNIIQAIHKLTAKGIPVFFMHGNRDLLIGKEFERLTGCQLIPDPTVIDLFGKPTLLMHGDTLCTDDIEYQEFRKYVRTTKTQQDFLALPIEKRKEVVGHYRSESQLRSSLKADSIMDVNQDTVVEMMKQHHVLTLIHGHTHRPDTHKLEIDGQPAQRIVLGDWSEKGSVLECLPDGFNLHSV